MTILSAILLSDLNGLYNRKFNFKKDEFDRKIKELYLLPYSTFLRQIVEGMCQEEPSKRLSCSEVV